MTTTPPAPTVTGYTDADPLPRVSIEVTPMPADAETVTVWRNFAGTQQTVRGAVKASVAGDFVVTDYDAPLGVDVYYTCQTTDSGGDPSVTSPASDTLNLDVTDAWWHDPLDPSTSMVLPLRRGGDVFARIGSFTGQQYTSNGQVVPQSGSPLPLGVLDVRQAASGLPVIVSTRNGAWTQVQQLLAQAAVLCLRVPPTVLLLDPVSYLWIPQYTPTVYQGAGIVEWSMQATQVRGPALNVILAVRSLDDLGAEADTLDGLGALYDTMLDLQRGA